MSRQRASPEATVNDPEPLARSRSTRDLLDGRWQRADSEGGCLEVTSARPRVPQRADSRRHDGAVPGITHHRKCQAVPHNVDYTTSEEDGQVSNKSDKDLSEFSSSDHGGHDNRQPKRQSSAKCFGASEWSTRE
jgi:hypothetical protein